MKKEIIETENSSKCIVGAICGGVISQSLFDSNPWVFMMQDVMPDDKFEEYKKANGKDRKVLFKKYGRSII